MDQITANHMAKTYTAFRAVVVSEAVVFLFAATLHTGHFGVQPLFAAMIVEGLCGIACVISAFAMLTHKLWARMAAMIVQIFILAGVLLGVAALIGSASIRTPINVGLHGLMLALIVSGITLLVMPDTWEAFDNDDSLSSKEG
jgi:hypothetical protein